MAPHHMDSQNLQADSSLQRRPVPVTRTSVILSHVIPSILPCTSHWPHFVVEEIDLENVRAVHQSQIRSRSRRPGPVSLLELRLCMVRPLVLPSGSDG